MREHADVPDLGGDGIRSGAEIERTSDGRVKLMLDMPFPDKHKWSRLNRLQLGKYAEYVVKMECILCGCDVFTAVAPAGACAIR